MISLRLTSGIRIGTPAITTRGLVESDMEAVVDLIDKVIMNYTNDIVIEQVESEVRDDAKKTFVYF
jgi:glycine hydroxymethyltransferase